MEGRYPPDLKIGLDDFTSSGWRQVLGSTERIGYPSMWQAMSAAARKAMEEGRQNHGKVLWLLADACSMMLSPKSPNEPFKSIFVFDGNGHFCQRTSSMTTSVSSQKYSTRLMILG
jgi:hypothetical protein